MIWAEGRHRTFSCVMTAYRHAPFVNLNEFYPQFIKYFCQSTQNDYILIRCFATMGRQCTVQFQEISQWPCKSVSRPRLVVFVWLVCAVIRDAHAQPRFTERWVPNQIDCQSNMFRFETVHFSGLYPCKNVVRIAKEQTPKKLNSLEIRTVVHRCSTQISVAYDVRTYGRKCFSCIYRMSFASTLCVNPIYNRKN